MDPLSAQANDDLRRVSRFFQARSQMATKVVEADFTDAEELLHEPEYTKDEVEEHFSNLKRVISSALQSEHKQMVNMFLALLKNVIQDAERKGVEVDIDTMAIEDASLLQEVEKLRTGSCLPEQAEMKPSRGKGQLLSIKDEHQNLVRQNSRLDSEVDRLQDRVRRLEAQSSSMVQEKLDLMKQLQRATELAETSVSQADRRAQSKDEDLGAARAALEETKGAYDARTKDMAELLRQTEDLKIQLRDAETENTSRLNQSKQVQQMRKMLTQKNDTIADLRRKLQRYEPDSLQADRDF